ncbi:hypothetical protein [Neisseria weixii]
MLKILKSLTNTEWLCLYIGMIVGGVLVLSGFMLGNFVLGKML